VVRLVAIQILDLIERSSQNSALVGAVSENEKLEICKNTERTPLVNERASGLHFGSRNPSDAGQSRDGSRCITGVEAEAH
jgi:hypothetical protein